MLTSIEGNFSSAGSVKSILFYKLDSPICVFSISYKKMVFFWLVVLGFIFGCSLCIKSEEKYLDSIQYFWNHMIFTKNKNRIKLKGLIDITSRALELSLKWNESTKDKYLLRACYMKETGLDNLYRSSPLILTSPMNWVFLFSFER